MKRSFGADMNWGAHASIRNHLRASPNAAYWLAEDTPRFGQPRVVGYARALVRDGVWMLTEFFVTPAYTGQGVGCALLDACLQSARGAHTRFILASQNPGADALYIRHARLLPRMPMLLLSGQLSSLANQWRPLSVPPGLRGWWATWEQLITSRSA